METNLTPQQQKFVEEYILTGNGTQSAINAGYSEKSARMTASRLLTNDNIQEYLKARREQITSELQEMFIGDALSARKVLISIMNDKNASDKVRLSAAKDLLDRAGFKPTDKKEITGKDGNELQIVFTNPE